VDCPVRVHVGEDIARTIFIDNGTTVEFTGAGKFTVDNVFVPAFVMANSSNITLTNWIVDYDGGLPISPDVGGYVQNGQFVSGENPGNAFNDLRLTPWLTTNRAIVFDKSQGNVAARWSGTTNACAMFYLTGSVTGLSVTGMQVSVPTTAGGNQFVPVVFSMSPNYKSNQTVNLKTPTTGQYFAVPQNLTFSNVAFDGTYMGFVGGVQNAVFSNIQSQRYGDLQDANGQNVGGIGKWFAPPHLFYLNYAYTGDPALFNKNIQITNVVDAGVRIGKARDLGGIDTISGNALSLKIGCISCSVDTYTSARPDGFIDVLASNGLTISNVTATYNSAFLNNIYPGWRFPEGPYTNVSFQNITLTDSAAATVFLPIDNAFSATNQGIQRSNVKVGINQWVGTDLPLPTFGGETNAVALNYGLKTSIATVLRAQVGTVETDLQGSPTTLRAGASTVLKWNAFAANSCTASGAWSGAVATGGTRTVTMPTAGSYTFTLECRNGSATSSTALAIVVQPS
jgi:hypothetical protein